MPLFFPGQVAGKAGRLAQAMAIVCYLPQWMRDIPD